MACFRSSILSFYTCYLVCSAFPSSLCVTKLSLYTWKRKMSPWKENVTLARIACWPIVTAEMMSKYRKLKEEHEKGSAASAKKEIRIWARYGKQYLRSLNFGIKTLRTNLSDHSAWWISPDTFTDAVIWSGLRSWNRDKLITFIGEVK